MKNIPVDTIRSKADAKPPLYLISAVSAMKTGAIIVKEPPARPDLTWEVVIISFYFLKVHPHSIIAIVFYPLTCEKSAHVYHGQILSKVDEHPSDNERNRHAKHRLPPPKVRHAGASKRASRHGSELNTGNSTQSVVFQFHLNFHVDSTNNIRLP